MLRLSLVSNAGSSETRLSYEGWKVMQVNFNSPLSPRHFPVVGAPKIRFRP